METGTRDRVARQAAWATVTVDGGKIVNLGAWNFLWHSYMIGVIGHILI